ncbi:IS66 family transposase, partial [Nodularia sp. LEGE 06071]|uniref:IS66 family transposase n=1 Tax=Nodularia sp. LEGE 06071 TaxID=2777965 RepID=UPI0030DB0D1B
MDKDLIIQLQQQQIVEQAKMILKLEARITELENNQKKNSTNSSKPPSSDMGKPKQTQSLRKSSGKKPGGQTGHSGETLSFSTTPDEIITHVLSHCACCGKNISGLATLDFERRQVYDLPPIEILVTEHQSEIKSCPKCNTVNKAAFPAGVSQPVQYGTGVQTLAAYFTQFQLLPYARTAQLFRDLFGHSVSASFLVNNNRRLAVQLEPFIKKLKKKLLKQPVLHADETGYYYQGRRNWLHTLCTEKHTFYMPHAKRGKLAMDAMGILPDYKGTLVHDFWKAYNDYCCNHALCNIHHLRDLTFCEEVLNCSWAAKAKQFFLNLLDKVKIAKESGAACLTRWQLQSISKKYNELITEGQQLYPPPKKIKGRRGVTKKSKTHNLLERFIHYKAEVLAFAKNFSIPFGNNLAEQAIRMVKVKQKISGCFR